MWEPGVEQGRRKKKTEQLTQNLVAGHNEHINASRIPECTEHEDITYAIPKSLLTKFNKKAVYCSYPHSLIIRAP